MSLFSNKISIDIVVDIGKQTAKIKNPADESKLWGIAVACHADELPTTVSGGEFFKQSKSQDEAKVICKAFLNDMLWARLREGAKSILFALIMGLILGVAVYFGAISLGLISFYSIIIGAAVFCAVSIMSSFIHYRVRCGNGVVYNNIESKLHNEMDNKIMFNIVSEIGIPFLQKCFELEMHCRGIMKKIPRGKNRVELREKSSSLLPSCDEIKNNSGQIKVDDKSNSSGNSSDFKAAEDTLEYPRHYNVPYHISTHTTIYKQEGVHTLNEINKADTNTLLQRAPSVQSDDTFPRSDSGIKLNLRLDTRKDLYNPCIDTFADLDRSTTSHSFDQHSNNRNTLENQDSSLLSSVHKDPQYHTATSKFGQQRHKNS